MAIAFCPDCEEAVRLGAPKLGQRVTCESCQAELEVVDVSPLELDWAYDEPVDDWEEDDEDEWDDEDEEAWDDEDWDKDEDDWEDDDDSG